MSDEKRNPTIGGAMVGLFVLAALCHDGQGFERVGHVGVGQAVVAVAAARFADHEARFKQLGQVAAGGGWRH